MRESKRNALIGLFVLGGLVSLGVLIVKFGEATGLLRAGYVVHARFDRVTGMKEGLEVSLAGMTVGRVRGVDFVNRENPGEGVLVAIEVRREYSIPSGSVARTQTPVGVGQPTINIMPPVVPTTPVARDGTGQIRGEQTSPLSEVIDPRMLATIERTTAQIGELAAALTPAANDLHLLMEQRTIRQVEAATQQGAPTTQPVPPNLHTAIERLYQVLKHLDMVVGDPAVQSDFKDTLVNLRAASEDARQATASLRAFSASAQQIATKADGVIVKLDATVDTTHQRIDELGRSLQANSDKLSKLLDYAVAAGRNLAEGRGTLAMLLSDPQFYEELLLTVKRLNAAAGDMQALIRKWQAQGILAR
ncbi:MAG: hypothetical protein AMXMBFR83_30090 [Phycisphaerae bacterium]